MKFVLAGVILIFLVVSGLFFVPHSFGQTQMTPAPDFTTAVQAGLQALATSPTAQSQQQEIQNQDYKSTWDEFGVNALVDGNTPPVQIQNQVTQDIVQSVETAQNYDQQEANYLQATQNTPEQVQATENSVGVDLPPGQPIDANPSIDANPNVSASPVDTSAQDNTVNNISLSNMGSENVGVSTSTNEIVTATSTAEVNVPSITTSTIPVAGLEIAKSVDNALPKAGATINYTLTVSALGPDTSTDVIAIDILPLGIIFVNSTSSVGTYNSSTGVWSIGDMAANSTTTLVITATVDASSTVGQSISNAATVSESSAETNANKENTSSSATITIAASDNMIFDAILSGELQPATSTEAATTTTVLPDVVPSNTTPSPDNIPLTQ